MTRLDLELDTGIGARASADPFGEQLTIDVADAPPVREGAHGLTGDQDLAARTVAAQAALKRAEGEADDYDVIARPAWMGARGDEDPRKNSESAISGWMGFGCGSAGPVVRCHPIEAFDSEPSRFGFLASEPGRTT
jgi:hypothetical protein